VIAALESAVEAAPDNSALRKHLLKLLIEGESWQDALGHARALLEVQPADVEALEAAAAASEALGETEAAAGYRKLALALGGESAVAETAVDEPESGEQEFDEPEAEAARAPGPEPVELKVIPGGMSSDVFAESEDEKVMLDDVAGMEEVKRRLHLSFLGPLRNPELMKQLGKQLRGGLLLYGPPGCGKTYLARAVAGELGARFLSVALSDVLDMYLGVSERNLHEIFENARRNSPCVLFFDEIDALGRKRSLRRESAGRDVVNQLLSELDSVSSDNSSMFVLAATNHPWDVDAALRRPGRLDRMLLVLPPDEAARRAILERSLESRPTEGVDLDWLAKKTEDFSGADVVHLCESAAELAIEASIEADEVRPVKMEYFRSALKDVKPSTRPWLETARNYAMFSNDGGAYDSLLDYLRRRKMA